MSREVKSMTNVLFGSSTIPMISFFIDFKFEINDFSNKLFISNGSCFISFRSYLFVIAIINDYLLLNIVCLNSDLISK